LHGAQLAAEDLLDDGDPVGLEDPLRKVDQTPAHHAVTAPSVRLQSSRSMRAGVRPRTSISALAPCRYEPYRTAGVEPQNPIANGLQPEIADAHLIGKQFAS
jgi:hypothetical protein